MDNIIKESWNERIEFIDRLLNLRDSLGEEDKETIERITHLVNAIVETMIIDTKPTVVIV